MVRNSGRSRRTIRPTLMPSTGTTASSTDDSGTSRPSAITMPPTHMIGADTISVNAISTSIWTCWTSLVVRVISVGAPNWPSSRAEKDCTRSNTAPRTSRPTAAAVRAPYRTAPMLHTICPTVTASIRAPKDRMYPVSPLMTPLSMMSAFRVGR